MATKKKMLQAAAGNAGGEALNVEDVFSTYLYTGTGAAGPSGGQTITNGIDLAGEGGLVWIKSRNNAYDHRLTDTERGVGKSIETQSTEAETDTVHCVSGSFNSDGFSIGDTGTPSAVNTFGDDLASWTFRKAPKFFDVVTWTSTGSPMTIAHNLGSVPGMIIVKSTNRSTNWAVYHRGANASPETVGLFLNLTFATDDSTGYWNDTAPTSTHFTVGDGGEVGGNAGDSMVAYLFAHNDGDGEFGADGDADIIKCGSYTTTDTGVGSVDLGFEPQWILVRASEITNNWFMADNMRGWSVPTSSTQATMQYLFAHSSSAESDTYLVDPTATGFDYRGSGSNRKYIYMAIRRGTKVPESGTEVFDVTEQVVSRSVEVGTFPVDMSIAAYPDNAGNNRQVFDRLRGTSKTSSKYLQTNTTNAEASAAAGFGYDNSSGYIDNFNSVGYNQVYWNWKRAPGFFDVVAYTGTASPLTLSHNLGVAPELILYKSRSASEYWFVQSSELTSVTDSYMFLNYNNAEGSAIGTIWRTPDATTFGIDYTGNLTGCNISGVDYIAYLFASLPGISKVGSYVGDGTEDGSKVIDCGFTSGARFVLIKKVSSGSPVGSWICFDTVRGIVAGIDPELYLNETLAEGTAIDWIDPDNSGFKVVKNNQNVNQSGANYIFYAIA